MTRRLGTALWAHLVLQLAAVGTSGANPPAPPPTAATPQKLVYTQQSMGTTVQVTVWTADERKAAEGADAVFAEFRRIDAMMTTWTADSEISRINTAAGKAAVAVSEETFTVLERSVATAKKSRGLFDVTVGAFKGLWKFDEDMDKTLPDPADVRARLRRVDWRQLRLDPKKKTARLGRAGMSITLGGIAKGYSVDRAAAILRQRGLTSFIIQAGGDLFVSGDKSGAPWVVGIRDPRGDRDSTFAVAAIRDRSFSTSGDYERGFVKDGVRYHHILDPRTGQPARKTRSVTVMAKDAFTADAWSKVLFILGAKEGLAAVEKDPDVEAVFVDADNKVHISSGLRDVVKVLHPPTAGI